MVHRAQLPCRSPVGYGKENVNGRGNKGEQREKLHLSSNIVTASLHLGSLPFPFLQILACCHHNDGAATEGIGSRMPLVASGTLTPSGTLNPASLKAGEAHDASV